MKTTVVRYTLRPECINEHLELIRGVFDQLAAQKTRGVRYEVIRLGEDGLNFVHIATLTMPTNPTLVNPLTALNAFKEFAAKLKDRVADPPLATEGTRAFSYESHDEASSDSTSPTRDRSLIHDEVVIAELRCASKPET